MSHTFELVSGLKIFFGFICITLLVFTGNSQVRLSGTVVNGDTGQPVPFAQVSAGDLSTFTNNDGDFVIYASESSGNELEVCQLGFDFFRTDIRAGEPYQISLVPERPGNTILDSLDVEDIMRQVFLRFVTNYEYEDQLISSYYKEKLTGGDELFYFAEGVMDLYLPSDVYHAAPLVRPVKSRINYIQPYQHKGADLSDGGATQMIQSSVRVTNSFLSPKNRWNYDYYLADRVVYRDTNVFVIDFYPASKKGYLAGRIYVDATYYGIVRLEYYYVNDPNKVWTEEFAFRENTYYLVRTSFEDRWVTNGQNFVFSSMLVNNKIQTDQEEEIDWKNFTSGKHAALENASVESFTDDFWKNETCILLDAEERTALLKE